MDKHGEGGEVAEREIFTAEPEIFLLDLIVTCGLEGDCSAYFIVSDFSFSIFLTRLFVQLESCLQFSQTT